MTKVTEMAKLMALENLSADEIIKNVDKRITDAPSFDSHESILAKLLDEVSPIDFEGLAFPELKELRAEVGRIEKEILANKEDAAKVTLLRTKIEGIEKQIRRCKLSERHYLILSVEEILRLAEANKWNLAKEKDTGLTYLYNGAYWKQKSESEMAEFLGQAAEKMNVNQFTARFFTFREKLYRQFLTSAYLETPEPDVNKVQINLLNGTYEITNKGKGLVPFSAQNFLTHQLPFCYDPSAKAPIFMKYLDEVLPPENEDRPNVKERQNVLAEYLGSVFLKNGSKALKIEKVLLLYGSGANGKSVLYEVYNALLGPENVSCYSLPSLTNENGYYRANIADKLANYASEINGSLETSIFKQLASGEPVEARRPYCEPFIMKQYAKLIFNTNELPKDVEHTTAYFRRFLIIPFDQTIPVEKQDKSLHTKIIENELAGVFNWILEGLDRLLKNKTFSECDAAKKALEKYQTESDSIKLFIEDEGYKKDRTNMQFTRLSDLFLDYKSYCIQNMYKCCSLRTFAERLRGAEYSMEKKNIGQVVYIYR